MRDLSDGQLRGSVRSTALWQEPPYAGADRATVPSPWLALLEATRRSPMWYDATLKVPTTNVATWPGRVFRPIGFIATLPTAKLYLQQLLWSRQIEESYARIQSEAEVHLAN